MCTAGRTTFGLSFNHCTKKNLVRCIVIFFFFHPENLRSIPSLCVVCGNKLIICNFLYLTKKKNFKKINSWNARR